MTSKPHLGKNSPGFRPSPRDIYMMDEMHNLRDKRKDDRRLARLARQDVDLQEMLNFQESENIKRMNEHRSEEWNHLKRHEDI
jgi:hypothetical protein